MEAIVIAGCNGLGERLGPRPGLVGEYGSGELEAVLSLAVSAVGILSALDWPLTTLGLASIVTWRFCVEPGKADIIGGDPRGIDRNGWVGGIEFVLCSVWAVEVGMGLMGEIGR
jgi:hypothetical protein